MIRFVTEADTTAILSIYSNYITTPITFEYSLPTQEEFAERISVISQEYPYLVYEEDGKILAYAYAHRHMEREAYQWNAELSVYLAPAVRRKGIGSKLYAALLTLLKEQNIHAAYACITLPNEGSIRLHERMGFTEVGLYPSAGYKCGSWYDVCWYRKPLREYEENPAPFLPIHELSSNKCQAILREAFLSEAAIEAESETEIEAASETESEAANHINN